MAGSGAPQPASYVGRRMLRPEDGPLLRGAATFVADIARPGRLDVAFVRSWAAHGRLTAVDAAAALGAPGVVAAFTGADLLDVPDVPPVPRSAQPAEMRRRALATDRVRFVGEPVAMVLAGDRYRAEDGADLVAMEIDPLPAVLDPVAATAADAVRLFDGVGNVAGVREVGEPCEAELAGSPVVVELTVDNQRLAPMSLEARAILAEPDGSGLRVWCSHQAPHRLRAALARLFGLDPERVRVTVPFVGGAFGAKSQVYAEYLAVVAAALRLGRPVRWVEDRSEAFTAATHGRGQHTSMRLGLDRDGRFRALDADIIADVGGYPHTGDFIPEMTAWVMSGPYRIPAVHVRTRSVVTTKTPTASYRGAGRPEAAYALERLVDTAAARLGMDPAELRRRNFIDESAFPYQSPTGALYDSGRHASALAAALAALDVDRWRAEQRSRRDRGTGPLLGIGLASWVERSGGERGGSEYARVELADDGRLVARVGTATQGQGHQMTLAQVVAEATGVPPEAVDVRVGDTAEVRQGTGAFGSRTMQVGGNAAYLAAQALVGQARAAAAELLGCPADDVVHSAAGFHPRDDESAALTVADVATKHGPLAAEEVFAPPQAFPFGCYAAVVDVDRETGSVTVRRLVAVDDCGVVVNPMVVEGQIVGSIAQGLGQALYEEARFDDDGNPVTTTLLDYAVPTVAEVPDLTLVDHVTPNPHVPLGTKGAGESGAIGAPPAVANAVFDALRDYDTTGLQMPFTAERVWACLQRPRAGSSGAAGHSDP